MSNAKRKSQITKLDLDVLVIALLDNIDDTPAYAWDSLEQAIRMHHDDISEMAHATHGRRLTATEWKSVSAFALRVGTASSKTTAKFLSPGSSCKSCIAPAVAGYSGYCAACWTDRAINA